MRFDPVRPLLAALSLAVATSGCFITTDTGPPPAPPSDEPAVESVDIGATMDVPPGRGAGLFVEYLGAGAWSVYTSCDTLVTEQACVFDVIVSTPSGAAILAPKLAGGAHPEDTLSPRSDGGLRFVVGTESTLVGVTFSTQAGAPIEIDMLLDGQARPDFIHWMNGGAHVVGTTTNPVDFLPTAP